MITNKKINIICVCVILFAVLFTVIFMNGESLGMTVIEDGDAEKASDSEYFTANDINSSWNTDIATKITLNGDSAKISGSGAYFMNGDLYITQRGYFVISGELEDGSIIVSAKKSSKIWIMLNGVTVKTSDDAALRVNQAKKVFLTLGEGTVNTLSDSNARSEEALADETSGCIYAHDNIAINGSGSLTVNGNYSHGIVAKDNLIIAGGNITVNAQDDAIRANGAMKFRDAVIEINCYDDGLVINKAEGYMYILSGTIDIISGDDAIHAAGDIEIDGGTLTIHADDDAIHSDTNIFINGGTVLINECKEGVEALAIVMNGGDVTIYPEDDGFNANGGSGDMFGDAGQGGFPGGNGDPDFGTSSGSGENSGFPGGNGGPDFGTGSGSGESFGFPGGNGGPDFGTSSGSGESFGFSGGNGGPDFGANSGSGESNGMMQPGEMPGMNASSDSNNTSTSDDNSSGTDSSTASSQASFISISGGKLTIVNTKGVDCDGLDSNGSIYISGGDIRISLPGSGTNSAIDYGSESNGVCEISGGTVVACGGSEMVEAFDSTSSQCSIFYYTSGAAGSTVSVSDASGNTLISYEVPNKYTSANISCPELKIGETYTISVGNKSEEITLEEISTTVGSSSEGAGGFPGMSDGTTQISSIVFSGESHKSDDSTVSSSASVNSDLNETLSWGMIGASFAAMAIGLAFAMLYKKRY